ncbi:hypothetical protein HMPREF9103_01836 [Lentilactobacillus parafarraginis F0439]|uniref:Uncharacterized protein n=1 Tax=Lentilactobacillus parafarraginis F0439 TaxID=797515 RepID=G9ZQ31_9LACO|nr:hypothetical protein [Lentilactobacillus parafarraginis]EHL97856.1 hypothetical protein HMPREF9103_01836 [Lentilactobacillus parafarraginis F0439]
MNQENQIAVSSVTTLKTDADGGTTALINFNNVSGDYTRDHFHNWVNFSGDEQGQFVKNIFSERLTLHLESFDKVISFINSLSQADFVKFHDDSVQKGRFEITSNTVVHSFDHSVILENDYHRRVHDVFSNQEVVPMSDTLEYVWYWVADDKKVDGREDFEFPDFKRVSAKNEVNHFRAPFLWFDGERFRKETTKKATQFVIECVADDAADNLLDIINDPDNVRLEVNTVNEQSDEDGDSIELPSTHAYIEGGNTVVVTSVHG